ncbi:hypothetical protein C2S51_031396 [Perilla frutescens var. frutescens]|nr:hypothetical protein C2S51_031396 [Perilla frutescens var. frutescens]
MPGIIHVTVLEFKGVSSAKSLKVSMGKRQFQTWDKGSFSFPITRIRENLVVALLDAGGNEIAHQDIRTMQIIEKGSWDEVFSINGGGHVHMKLQFTLSEEDRSRIRVMRESAMKKKLETNPNIKLGFSEAVTSTSGSVETSMKDEDKVSASAKGFLEIDLPNPKVEASQAGSSPASATSSAVISLSSHQMDGRLIRDSAISNATDDGSQGAPSSSVKHGIEVEKIEAPQLANIRSNSEEGPSSELPRSSISDKNNVVASRLQDDQPVQKPQKQGPVKKIPSNVKKMISAFENSQLQEVKSMKSASVPSQLNMSRKEGLLEDRPTKTVVSPADKTLTDFKDRHLRNLQQLPTAVSGRAGEVSIECEPSQAEKELPSTVTPTLSKEILKEGEKSTVDLTRQLASETATSSGRMAEKRTRVPQPYDHSSRLLNSSESSVAEGSGRGRGTGLKSSTMNNIQLASNPEPKTLEYYKEECLSAQSSGMWIFPDNTRRLCITTAGEQVMKIVGHHHSEAKPHQTNKISSEMQKNPMHEKEHKMEKNPKKIHHQPESGSASSPNGSSNGLVGQVIKIAVIVGFGVLVLLTRQKEPRKKHKEEKDSLFHIPDYADETTMKPWTGKQ